MSPAPSRDYFRRFLKVPFASRGRDLRGWDCYGLYRYVLHDRFGIAIPSYAETYIDTGDEAGISSAIKTYRHVGWDEVQDPREGDAIVLRIAGVPWHCGYVIEPGIMLHAKRGAGTCIERYTTPIWEKRLEGFYRCKS